MKKHLFTLFLVLSSFTSSADGIAPEKAYKSGQFRECAAVSLYTMQGRELNAIVAENRPMKQTNVIPEGWTVVGVTEKQEAGATSPYIVICR